MGVGDHVGIYAYNGIEWVEAMMALYKIRAVPVNINYRYVENELKYLCTNADLVAIVAQQEFAPRIAAIRSDLPKLDACGDRGRRERCVDRRPGVHRLRSRDRGGFAGSRLRATLR